MQHLLTILSLSLLLNACASENVKKDNFVATTKAYSTSENNKSAKNSKDEKVDAIVAREKNNPVRSHKEIMRLLKEINEDLANHYVQAKEDALNLFSTLDLSEKYDERKLELKAAIDLSLNLLQEGRDAEFEDYLYDMHDDYKNDFDEVLMTFSRLNRDTIRKYLKDSQWRFEKGWKEKQDSAEEAESED